MISAQQQIAEMLKSPQHKMSIRLLIIFSSYNAYYKNPHAEDTLVNKILHHFHLSKYNFDYLMAGDDKIEPSVYHKVIKYLYSLPKCRQAILYFQDD